MEYNSLLQSKNFSLNSYPEGKFWELVVDRDEDFKKKICMVFSASIEILDVGVDIDTLILQCAEDFSKCLFYYDCNSYDMTTEEFMSCIKKI